MRALRTTLFLLILAAPAAGVLATPGDVLSTVPTPRSNSLGMAFDGQSFWVADRMTDRIYRVNPSDGKITDSLPTPRYDPLGIAFDGRWLWCVDADDQLIYAIDPNTRKVERTIPSPVSRPTGLAWDGTHLWLGDDGGNRLHRINVTTGVVALSLPSPSSQPCGMTFDGTYLWVTDRIRDEIYMVDTRKGDVVITLRSPGPHPWGLAWDGKNLWTVDYQTDLIYELVVDDNTHFTRYDGKAEHVEFVHQVRNFGPDTLRTLNVNFALPENRDTQDLLDSIRFAAAPQRFSEDKWGQKIASWEFRGLPPGAYTDVRMTVPVRTYKTRYFVFPNKVGTLRQIPTDVREKYLGDDKRYSMNDPIIRQALKEAISDEQNPYWISRRIYNYVIEKLTYELAGGWSNAPEVLRSGRGSCSEYSFVFIAMCRAAGVPARFAGSVMLRGDDACFDNVFHRWVEIYFPNYGWIPVDPSGGDSPWPSERADNFGFLNNEYLITTVGGGGSEYLDWGYNSHEWWTARTRCNVSVKTYAEWSPFTPPELTAK